MKTTLILVTAALTLSACASIDTPPVENGERTRSGAIIGGLLGAAAGALSDNNDQLERAIVGGAIGAATGAGIGQLLDRQARDLEATMRTPGVQITNTGDSLVVTMPQDILFDVDSAVLRQDLQADIGALAANLQQYPNTTVDVVGHTDSDGDAGYNQDLSTRRANAVSQILLQRGVLPGRVRAIGRGEEQPVATNLSEAGKRQNRRVEVIIRPIV